jgi:hypothetical protein
MRAELLIESLMRSLSFVTNKAVFVKFTTKAKEKNKNDHLP